jgi:hypothetical protein
LAAGLRRTGEADAVEDRHFREVVFTEVGPSNWKDLLRSCFEECGFVKAGTAGSRRHDMRLKRNAADEGP